MTAPLEPLMTPAAAAEPTLRLAIPRWMSQGMRWTERLAPGVALRWALRLFFTPMPSKGAARARPLPAGWRLQRLPFEGGRLAVWRREVDNAPRGRLLLVHGWGGDAGQLHALAERAVAAGFEPVMGDFPGHGRSDGSHSTLPQFVRAMFALQAHLGPWQGVVGHSLGAMAAAQAVARGLSTPRLAMIAPPPPPADVISGFAAALGLGPALARRMQRSIEATEGMPLADFEAAALAARVALPTLVVHDRGDRTAPWRWGQRLAASLPHGRLFTTEGLGHRRVLSDPGAIDAVLRFLTEPATDDQGRNRSPL